MDDQQFLTTKDVLGYAEEYIVLEETGELYNFSLSNSLDDIKTAIYSRTGRNFDLDNAYWRINSDLSISVKQLMYKHNAVYSMTTWYEKEMKCMFLMVNMRVGDSWFITRYNEQGYFIYNYEKYLIFKKFVNITDIQISHDANPNTVIDSLNDIWR